MGGYPLGDMRNKIFRSAQLAQSKRTQPPQCGYEGTDPYLEFVSLSATGLTPDVHIADAFVQLKTPCEMIILTGMKVSMPVWWSPQPVNVLQPGNAGGTPNVTGMEQWIPFPGAGGYVPAETTINGVIYPPYIKFKKRVSSFYINVYNNVGGAAYAITLLCTNDIETIKGFDF